MLSDATCISWATVLAVSLLSTSTSIVTHGSDMEHPLHAKALLMLLARGQEDTASASNERLRILRPAVLYFCWYLERAMLGPVINVDTMPMLRDYIDQLEQNWAGSCENAVFQFQNPLSCMGMKYSAPSLLGCSPRTLQILEDTRDFLNMVLRPPASFKDDAGMPYAILVGRIMGCQRLSDDDIARDPIYESCRLCAQLTVQMAVLRLPRYWTRTSIRHDHLERLIAELSLELLQIDRVHLWKQHNCLLFWVLLVGTCMSRSTAQFPLFKTYLFRLSSIHIFSDYDDTDAGFALSLKNFVAFQAFCASEVQQLA